MRNEIFLKGNEGEAVGWRESDERMKNKGIRETISKKPKLRQLAAALRFGQMASSLFVAASQLLAVFLQLFVVRLCFDQSRDHFVFLKHFKAILNMRHD